MSEVFFYGSAGRIEGQYHHNKSVNAPLALVLHPHPQYGGNMNNKVVYNLYHVFIENGFSVLRINFRGVGKSSGVFDKGLGEINDAATAADWLQGQNNGDSTLWVAGFSFGSWVALQLMMRRPEVQGFIAISPPANKYDFSFLSPCPVPGLIVQGNSDSIVEESSVSQLATKLKNSVRSAFMQYSIVDGADHFFRDNINELISISDSYIKLRFIGEEDKSTNVRKSRLRRVVQQMEHEEVV